MHFVREIRLRRVKCLRAWGDFFHIALQYFAKYAIISAEVVIMRKEIEINGCVEIPCEISVDAFTDAFIEWIESKGWRFGGGFTEIVDGYYINSDGTKGKPVLEA